MHRLSLASLTPRRMLHLPPRTVRLRLTLLYSGLFLVSGAMLLAITYFLFRRATGINLIVVPTGTPQEPAGPDSLRHLLDNPEVARYVRHAAESRFAGIERGRGAELHQLLVQSGIALAIMTVVSIALGWLVAGRVLRPLRAMTATAQRISERNLHERLALSGPRDELKDLADTVDGLLARLETAFGAQQRFVANAAHELRTPLTLWRALLEERLTDPAATVDSFRATSRRLLALGEEQERLLESLLTLASSERGLGRREPFDLAAVAGAVLRDPPPEAASLGVRIDSEIEPAPTVGDAALAERLARNLLDNAVSHNIPGGRVRVSTGTDASGAFISVTNDGAVIPAAEVERLFEPFQRLDTERTASSDDHHGLGLSIVRAIATAHRATLLAEARPDGGLAVEVRFPLRGADRNADLTAADRHESLVVKREAPTGSIGKPAP
ncbi:MAG TPA: HAMP domain-containing sensor histidine kinase [Solirubrobacterales bacterium]|nr:HAMP domain-containing sensor histidine kinase [Solirubrobacterales bacterium]